MTATFNPSDAAATIALSNGDLTATNSFGLDGSVRTVESASSGKYYYEAICGGTADTTAYRRGVAIGNSSAALTTGLGSPETNSGNVFQGDSNFYVAGSGGGTGCSYAGTGGDNVSVALDLDNDLIWYRANGGNWNSNGSADPASGVGGNSISGLSKPLFVMAWSTQANGIALTFNFGATAYAYTAPSGFGDFGASAPAGIVGKLIKANQTIKRASYW